MNENEGANRQTVLIVDDVPDNIALLSALLKDRYRTRAATSGQRALDIVTADPVPDMILLDIMMPNMDGYEVCRRLKADPRTAGIPVIFLTARTQDDDEELGLKLGAVDYLSKPVNPLCASPARSPTPITKSGTAAAIQRGRRGTIFPLRPG